VQIQSGGALGAKRSDEPAKTGYNGLANHGFFSFWAETDGRNPILAPGETALAA
jgi:hypothetical protein